MGGLQISLTGIPSTKLSVSSAVYLQYTDRRYMQRFGESGKKGQLDREYLKDLQTLHFLSGTINLRETIVILLSND